MLEGTLGLFNVFNYLMYLTHTMLEGVLGLFNVFNPYATWAGTVHPQVTPRTDR